MTQGSSPVGRLAGPPSEAARNAQIESTALPESSEPFPRQVGASDCRQGIRVGPVVGDDSRQDNPWNVVWTGSRVPVINFCKHKIF